MSEKKKMNLPNRLTMLRLCLVPVVMVLLLLPVSVLPWQAVYASGAVLFILTALTDMLDGKIARGRNLITDFGKFMDPVADKFMVIGTLMALLFRMTHPEYYGLSYNTVFKILFFVAVIIIIFRELAITSLRLVLVNASGKVVAANMLGKIKTVCQIICICTLLIEPFLDLLCCRIDPTFFFAHFYPLSWLTVGLMLVFTLWSGINYLVKNWHLVASDW